MLHRRHRRRRRIAHAPPTRHAARHGYALLWALVMMAVVSTVFAMVAPDVAGVNDRDRVLDTYATLAAIDSGVVRFGTVVKRVGTVYPGDVHQLSALVTTADQVSCQNNSMNPNSITTWTANGPFIAFLAPPNGRFTPLGVINDSIEHTAANQPMYLRMPAVPSDLVTLMDQVVDDGDGGAAGTILFGTPAAGVVDLRYRIGFAPSFTLLGKC
jgi:hypothetical protein